MRVVTTSHHAFVDGDAGRCGAILRHETARSLRTRTVFRMGGDAPVYLVDHVVEHDGDVRGWTSFSYDSPTSGTHHMGTRDLDGTVHVDGDPAPWLRGAVGGYGEHLLVAQVLAGDHGAMSFRQLDEGEPAEAPRRAQLVRQGRERTELLDGSLVDAERVQLVVAGSPSNTHWARDGVVVKSDWCGAQSFLLDDVTALCAGLDQEVVGLIEDFTC